jgi:hypothetical protein
LNLKLENGFGHPHKSRGNPANERRKKMEELNRLIDQAKSKIGDSDVAIDKVGEIKLFISPTTSQDLSQSPLIGAFFLTLPILFLKKTDSLHTVSVNLCRFWCLGNFSRVLPACFFHLTV